MVQLSSWVWGPLALGVLCGEATAYHMNGMIGRSLSTSVLGARTGPICQTSLGRYAGPSLLVPNSRAKNAGLVAMATMMDDVDIDGIGADYEDDYTATEDQYCTCGSCRASYMIDLEELGDGRKVKCEVCDHTWFQSAAKLLKVKKTDKVKPFPVDDWKSKREDMGNIVTRHKRTGAVTLFVGNMPFSVTEEKLREVFGQCGEVSSLSIICDPNSGRPKGYGFVDFVEKESGDKALNMVDGMTIEGRELAVKISEDKYASSDTRGGRGGRGGGRGGGDFRGRGRGGGGPPANGGRDSSGKFTVVKRA